MTPSVNRKRPQDPSISVPKPSEDKPKFGRVGIIAAVGFIVGVAWPGLAKLELVPRPPNEPARVPAALGTGMPLEAAASASALPPPAGASPAATPTAPTLGSVEHPAPKVRLAEVVSCVDADGKKHRRCGELSLDKLVTEPMRSLLACDGVEGQAGVFSLGFDVDFNAQKLSSFTVGRSTTLPPTVAKDLRDCADTILSKLELTGIEHGFSSYRVFYLIEFQPPSREASSPSGENPSAGGAVDSPAPGVAPGGELLGASGRATVSWEVALVRKAPKDGAVVARVLGGTRLVVTGRQGDWYRVKYDAQGNEGFVFKAAIGL